MDIISLFSSSQVGCVGKSKKVLSANRYIVEYLQASSKSFKYNKNKKGPKTEPGGTPFSDATS